ncbi:calcium uniporter protein, mitochondrial [Trichuris trichiura]|uniref:Calcium uniporter protein n=1 Tax=Trichuris trichiura TaxID=36087 RepID=A0A077Z0P6_TRITR|nr:calcium uniporter protein, mitochondrial [Trichuris trichiura]
MLQNGFALLKLKLPSQSEHCLFVLQLQCQTIGDLKRNILKEDDTLQSVAFYLTDNQRIADSSPVTFLLKSNFKIRLNQTTSQVNVEQSIGEEKHFPELSLLLQTLQMHQSAQKIEEQEKSLAKKLSSVHKRLMPLNEQVECMVDKADRRTKTTLWFGLCYLGAQAGILARLTWWEYSWDVMEPVTYFVTYMGVLLSYGYFLITRQPYEYPVVKDRITATYLHRAVTSSRFDVGQYEALKKQATILEQELYRLRQLKELNSQHANTP